MDDTYTAVCVGRVPPDNNTCSSKCYTLTNGGDQISLQNITIFGQFQTKFYFVL